MVKRDEIPQQTRKKSRSKAYLGSARGNALPKTTTNEDPQKTAEHQNEYFISKILKLDKSTTSSNTGPLHTSTDT